MGQCEIVIKRTQEIDDESLFHSDTFLGDEFSDEMYHWKYIKKKKVNGKWRYYYDIKDALGYDERQQAGQAVYDYNRAIENAEGYRKIQNDPGRTKHYSQAKMDQKDKAVKESGIKANRAVQKYYKTPLGKIDRLDDKIDSGRKAVAKLLNKLATKITPKDEHLWRYR